MAKVECSKCHQLDDVTAKAIDLSQFLCLACTAATGNTLREEINRLKHELYPNRGADFYLGYMVRILSIIDNLERRAE
jgi:hypothetical protein